jgi:hypothetical protein
LLGFEPARFTVYRRRDSKTEAKSPGSEERAASVIVAPPPEAPDAGTNPATVRDPGQVRDDSFVLTIEVLRQKLDRAIVAEAWDAVKAIRERMIEVERDAAGNVVSIRRGA